MQTKVASDDKSSNSSALVHSVVVATRLLEFLAEAGRPQRVTDIAEHLGMTKARVSRHLSTLSELGMVARMPNKSGYRLGPTLFRLSNAALDQYEITNIASRHMTLLRNQINESLLLAIPAGGDALVVSTMASGRPLSPRLVRGTRWSIPTSPTASVILAFSAEYVRERVLSRRSERETEREVFLDPEQQRKELALIRRRFYAFDVDPHDSGFSVVSAPVFDHAERIEAAITIVMNRRPSGEQREVPHLQPLKETAIAISRSLGSQQMAEEMAATL